MAWYQNSLARWWALTEAYYVAIGSGTNQHTGIFVGGDTDALTFNTDNGADSDGNVLLEGIWKLFFTLKAGYRMDAAWLMDDMTAASWLGLAQSNEPIFGAHSMTISPSGQIMLCGKPLYTQDDIDTKASSTCFVMFGCPQYYTLVERGGLTVSRNPYLYQANGQVGIFSSFRQSGTVTVEEAWVGGVGA